MKQKLINIAVVATAVFSTGWIVYALVTIVKATNAGLIDWIK